MVKKEVFFIRSWVWWVPLLFVLLTLCGILLYQAAFAGETAILENRLENRAAQLEELRDSRRKAEGFLEKARTQSDSAGILYRDHFSTEDQRFTRMMREVKELASRSGLAPSAISYPETVVEDHGLVRRNVNFGVTGTYDQLRTFVNFLELTDQFLTLESVNLGGGAAERDPRLRIRLSLATYFVRDPNDIGIDDVSFGSSVNDSEGSETVAEAGEESEEEMPESTPEAEANEEGASERGGAAEVETPSALTEDEEARR